MALQSGSGAEKQHLTGWDLVTCSGCKAGWDTASLGGAAPVLGGQALLPKMGDSLDTKKGFQGQRGRRPLEAMAVKTPPPQERILDVDVCG